MLQGLQVAAGSLLALLLAEGALRLRWGASTVQLPLYAAHSWGIGLQAGASAEGRLPSGQRYPVHLDARGLRRPASAGSAWLLVGDSLPFGLGVAGEETAAAAMTAAGLPTAAAGVPGYSLADALALAAHHAPPPPGIVILPNAVDDDRQGAERLAEQHALAGGRLLRRGAPAWAHAVYAHPLLRHSQLTLEGMRFLGVLLQPPTLSPRPRWVTDADGGFQAHADLGEMIRAFALDHPEMAVRVAWVPLPEVAAPDRQHPSPYGRVAQRGGERWRDDRAREGLRTGLDGGVPWLDLSEVFAQAGEDAYLAGDTHLSPAGNALLADHLRGWLAP